MANERFPETYQNSKEKQNPWNSNNIPWNDPGSEGKYHGTLFKFHGMAIVLN